MRGGIIKKSGKHSVIGFLMLASILKNLELPVGILGWNFEFGIPFEILVGIPFEILVGILVEILDLALS